MSTYVMSDLHGQYDAYKEMLEKIRFSDEDMLYILGDIVDRGPHPVKILLDLMDRYNVEVLIGNHEYMMCCCMKFLLDEITEENIKEISEETIMDILNWDHNGAKTTMAEMRTLSYEEKIQVLDFIKEFELYDEIEVGGKTFILVHAGLGECFHPDKELWEYELEDMVWFRPNYEVAYYPDKFVVSGHTPTQLIPGAEPGRIYQAHNHIAIDCGAAYRGGRLACIRLEDMEEFYVDIE